MKKTTTLVPHCKVRQKGPLAAGLLGTGLILGLRLANERRRYFVTPSLIGWAQA